MGFVYLNTFENIRKYDKGGMIGDPTEATVVNSSGDINIDNSSKPEFSQIIKDLSPDIVTEGKVSLIMNNSPIVRRLPNAYMYCVTSDRNDTHWEKEEAYDACIEIKDFDEFTRRISLALRTQGIFNKCLTKNCFFEESNGVISQGTTKKPDYFRKPPTHKIQKEIRSVFDPISSTKSLSPITLYIDTKDLIICL